MRLSVAVLSRVPPPCSGGIQWAWDDALCKDTGATLDDLREGVTTLEEIERIARQVFGGANPLVMQIAQNLGCARALLGARDGTAAVDALREAVAALGRA